MLKGLKGILEKAVQVAAPIIGGSMFGPFGAAAGSGIASLLTGNKPKDALISAGLSYGGSKLGFLPGGGQTGGVKQPMQEVIAASSRQPSLFGSSPSDIIQKAQQADKKGILENLFGKTVDFLGKKSGKDGEGPSYGAQILATGLPAALSYMAALQDAKKAGVDDPSEYMSAVDKLYGGQFAPPPEDRRIKNLSFQGIGGDGQPIYANQGGIMNAQQPVQYSAATGQGIMGMAKGGDVFPRKTGQIEGPGTKTSDSIPAMLSDGEFVQRTDAVNGAGVMMGATNAKEAREKGADFMYALQDKLAKMGQKVA
jgi:hypothetical protein